MGSLAAQDMAGHVSEGAVSQSAALSWHLASNCYPAIHSSLLRPLQRALKAYPKKGPLAIIVMNRDETPMYPRISHVTDKQIRVYAADLIDACNAWDFLEDDNEF